jgi:3-hydroxyacyl-[acyl-carrier-protein] dehydratase
VSPVLNRSEVQQILPHRDPFLFVDQVLEVVPGEKIVGLVRDESGIQSIEDESGESFFPPTLLAEAMAQVGAVLVLYAEENRGRTIYFRSIEEAKFHTKVPAGSTVRVVAEVRRMRGRLGSLHVAAFLGDDRVAEGLMGFAL